MLKKIIYSILIILWMGLIFILSNQDAPASSDLSNSFISNTIGVVYKIFDKNVSEEKLEEIKEIYSFPVRKLAHLTIYLVLGILVFLLINEFNLSYKNIILIALGICILYSISDEIHQLFVLNRSGELRDVLLDSLGSFIGISLASKFSNKS